MGRNSKKTLGAFLLSTFTFSALNHSAVSAPELVNLSGYLLDRNCADSLESERMPAPLEHSRECSLNPNCSRKGFALNSKGKWFKLDEKGNAQARRLLTKSNVASGNFVVIKGLLKGETLYVESLREVGSQ